MIPAITIRPEPGCAASVAALKGKGLEAHGFALFAVTPTKWHAPPPETIDALLLGSANAIRHGGDALGDYLGKPVYAVGQTTAKVARAAGFAVIATGEGGLQPLLGQVLPLHRHLLRLTGKRRVTLDPPAGIELAERVVYAANPLPMPHDLEVLLYHPAVVLLHSAEAARHFAGLVTAHGIAREAITLATIGARVSEAAGEGWAAIVTATTPSEDALLALAQQLCQNIPYSTQG
jgi:uroporphyrinogen-III synthase